MSEKPDIDALLHCVERGYDRLLDADRQVETARTIAAYEQISGLTS